MGPKKSAVAGLLVFLCARLIVPAQADAPTAVPASASPPLAVTIAVPEREGKRLLILHDKDPHFFVTLRNVSARPVRIFAADNSWGFYNLTLEITAIGGKALSKPLAVVPEQGVWLRNSAAAVTLESGDEVVREVRVPAAAHDSDFAPFPWLKPDNEQVVRMRAVFTEKSGESATRLGVWVGKASSEVRDYLVYYTVY